MTEKVDMEHAQRSQHSRPSLSFIRLNFHDQKKSKSGSNKNNDNKSCYNVFEFKRKNEKRRKSAFVLGNNNSKQEYFAGSNVNNPGTPVVSTRRFFLFNHSSPSTSMSNGPSTATGQADHQAKQRLVSKKKYSMAALVNKRKMANIKPQNTILAQQEAVPNTTHSLVHEGTIVDNHSKTIAQQDQSAIQERTSQDNSDIIASSPSSSVGSSQTSSFFKKSGTITSTIKSTLRRSSLASIVMMRRSFESPTRPTDSQKCHYSEHSAAIIPNDINLSSPSSVSHTSTNRLGTPIELPTNESQNEHCIPRRDSSQKVGHTDESPYAVYRNSQTQRNSSSSVKKNMKKHFSNAKIALRKLSLSSISIGHIVSLSQLPQSSVSAMASPCSLQTSAGASPVRDFSYFSERHSDHNYDSVNEEVIYEKKRVNNLKKSSLASATVSRVFRKKSATSPTIKRSLAPSLSWDPEQRSRSPSVTSRSRIHSDGSEDSRTHSNDQTGSDENGRKRRKQSINMSDSYGIYDRLKLAQSCLHCLLGAEHRRNRLRAEIETAVHRLSKRLDGSKGRGTSSGRHTGRNSPLIAGNLSPADSLISTGEESLRQQRIGTPDIVVSSFSSDDCTDIYSCSSLEQICYKIGASTLPPIKNNSRRPQITCNTDTIKEEVVIMSSSSGVLSPLHHPPPNVLISQADLENYCTNSNTSEINCCDKQPAPNENYTSILDQKVNVGTACSSTSPSHFVTPEPGLPLVPQQPTRDRPPPLHCTDFNISTDTNGTLATPSPFSATIMSLPSPQSAHFFMTPLLQPESPNNFGSEGEMTTSSSMQLIGVDSTDITKPSSPSYTQPLNESVPFAQKQLQEMDTLKPPGYYLSVGTALQIGGDLTRQDEQDGLLSVFTTDYSSSPPRSRSIDLSTLRRDIELWSISSSETNFGDLGLILGETKKPDGQQECLLEPFVGGREPPPTTPTDSSSVIMIARTNRSRSHDPTESVDHILRRPSRIEHLSEIFRKALAKSPVVKRAAALQEQEQRRVSKHRTSRYWLDEQLTSTEHIWLPSTGPGSISSSNDTECYVGESDCEKVGEKRRCAACHIVAHTACFSVLTKMNLMCKATFRDCDRQHSPKDTWDVLTKHHWVHRWKLEGRCQHCSKSFQQKMFRDKDVIAITCSWCKRAYHNKRSCFNMTKFDEKCDRGALCDLILPPSWLLRLSNNKNRRTKNALGNSNTNSKKSRRKYRPFVVKPMEQGIIGPSQPLLVFVNPKSGGNKGHKALHTLCWLLNPRQVFDITALKGPKYGLEMFRKVATQLKILVAGGDGTVGWVLSTLDQLSWPTYPPMALVPLGTGNDLSRCMGWGGVFSDEPLAEVLTAILHEATVTYLDRWRLDVQPNTGLPLAESNDEFNEAVQSSLPLIVMNNYFSIGADAHVALQFHHSRSANPQMLNSRLKNRIAYGGLGTIDLFKRTWKDLSEFMSLECDDVDITWKIREMKVHCVLFHNITYYAGGTVPWGGNSEETRDGEYSRPSCCDGKIEVLGFTTATLAALQMGGKGQIIAQCSKVRIETTKAIPMQVDGEPCLLAPSLIKLSFHSKVPMLKREKNHVTSNLNFRRASKSILPIEDIRGPECSPPTTTNASILLNVPIIVVGRDDFDTYRDSFDRLKDTGFEIGAISAEAEIELSQIRLLVQKLLSGHTMLPYESKKEWCFVDYVSNSEEGTFRVLRHMERSHSVSDICNMDECIIILDDSFPSMTNRSAAIGHDVVFIPAATSNTDLVPQNNMVRGINETLRIVLTNDAQETHL